MTVTTDSLLPTAKSAAIGMTLYGYTSMAMDKMNCFRGSTIIGYPSTLTDIDGYIGFKSCSVTDMFNYNDNRYVTTVLEYDHCASSLSLHNYTPNPKL